MTDNVAEVVANELHSLYDKHGIYNRVECTKGCSTCCHQIVTISIFEAIRLAEALVDVPDDEILDISSSATMNRKINNKIKIDAERWKYQSPCPLLVNDTCRLHAQRPIVCQVTNSISRSECERQLKDRNVRGHEVLGVTPPGLSNESINSQLSNVAVRLGQAIPSNIEKYAFQIDLDRLVEYIAKRPKGARVARLEKLRAYDKGVIKSLKKRSMNQVEYDSLNVR